MRVLFSLTLLALSSSALAHHPLAGQEMTTVWHGLFSGFGHPLLGFDHLFFVLLMGVAAFYTGRGRSLPLAYIATMLCGCLAVSWGLAVPLVELAVAISLLALGVAVLSGKGLSLVSAGSLFALAGWFHGAAFGGSMAAAEAGSAEGVLIGYLIGLGVTQFVVSILGGRAIVRLWGAVDVSAIPARLVGAMVAGVGLFLSLEQLEGAAFSALGVG